MQKIIYPSFAPESLEWIEKTIDAVFIHDQVPVVGSILYCNLAVAFEHTGIYVGNGHIVHLDGDGYIKMVGLKEFVARLKGYNPSFSIFCAVDRQGHSIGGIKIAERAMQMVGLRRNYNVVTDNCHRFTGYCVTGKYDACTLFAGLERILWWKHGLSSWRAIEMP